jgi:hypothetical protein
MLTPTKQSSEVFQIDGLGFAIFIKLVEARVTQDIENTKHLLETENGNLASLGQNQDGLLRGIRYGMCEERISDLKQTIQHKKQWIKDWKNKAWEQISQIPDTDIVNLQAKTWSDLEEELGRSSSLRLKRFLILQEAILAPMYKGIEGYQENLSEVDIYNDCEKIAHLFGFKRKIGSSILANTNEFVKGVTGYWSRIVKWTIGGTLVALLTAGLAAPAIATAIGSVMGLYGAAATSAGLAFFGGGALAAGGLGMAGGFTVLIGGGGLLGAITSATAAKVVHNIPIEVFIISSAKIVNYINFLSNSIEHLNNSNDEDSRGLANDMKYTRQEVLIDFLRSKHNFESSLVNEDLSNINTEKSMKYIKTFNFAYDKILGILTSQPISPTVL